MHCMYDYIMYVWLHEVHLMRNCTLHLIHIHGSDHSLKYAVVSPSPAPRASCMRLVPIFDMGWPCPHDAQPGLSMPYQPPLSVSAGMGSK